MKWNKYTLKTTTEATDFVSGIMIELGINGIQIEDNLQITQEEKEKMFIDYLPDLPEDDGVAYISFYTEENADDENDENLLESLREKLKEANGFINIGEGSIEKSTTEDVDWVNNWKKYFKSFTVGDFYIKPTWESVDEKYSHMQMIEIDPGTAFGTGKHETTQLCINQLTKYIKAGDEVLDLGCGSGILSIVAKKLGAGHVDMTDIDQAAIDAVYDNFKVNKIPMDDVEVILGNVLDDEKMQQKFENKKYDVVVANILADVIIPIAGIVDRFLKDGGIFISSGIIYMKEEAVKEAVENNRGLKLTDVVKQGDWRAVMAEKGREMYRFFVEENQIGEDRITITGKDVNHIRNVLRMNVGEKVLISNGMDREYVCSIDNILKDEVQVIIEDVNGPARELPVKVTLFQGLPKSDKMETVIQKMVELGAYEIVPVATKRCVVKLDAKKAEAKTKRWNLIAESAAKQSKRGIIPKVLQPVSFSRALEMATNMDMILIPYEEAENMDITRDIVSKIKKGMSVGIFIGPEGGFAPEEVLEAAEYGAKQITLGKRILRTETAGMTIMSVIMYLTEE